MSDAEVYIGFDFGIKRIGVAVGQSITQNATPLTILSAKQGKPNWAEIELITEQWQPTAFIVGVPKYQTGMDANIPKAAQQFANRVKERLNRPVFTVDETLTTREAHDLLISQPHAYKHKSHQQIDDIAAKIILEEWMTQGRRNDC